MKERLLRASLGFSLSALASACFADMVVTAHAEVTGTRVRGTTVPIEGDYRFIFGKNQATVSSPNGKRFVFDFERKTFTSIDPTSRTYYQAEIPSVLGVGDRLRAIDSSNKVKGSVTFEPTRTDSPGPDLARSAKNYRVLLESNLIYTMKAPSGFGGSVNSRGGFVFGGGGNAERSDWVGRRVLEGQLWMGDAPLGLDRDQMNTAIECVLLWGQPQLSELARRIHDSKLALFGGDFSVRAEGQRNVVGNGPPIVSIKLTSIANAALDPESSTVPSDYRRVSPPAGPLGG